MKAPCNYYRHFEECNTQKGCSVCNELSAEPVAETSVSSLIAEVAPPPLVVSETAVRQLRPLLEELIRRRASAPPETESAEEAYERGQKDHIYRTLKTIPPDYVDRCIIPYSAPKGGS
jgi:hypothetical protein